MLAYLARRGIDALLTILLVLSLVFVALRVLPGDPAAAALGDLATQDQLDAFRAKLGLNAPLPVQYAVFLWQMLRFDFGRSFVTDEATLSMLRVALPYTLELTFAAIVVGAAIGVPAGVVSATQRGRVPDFLARGLSLLGFCVPEFYLAALILIVFAVKLDLFPVMGGGDTLPDRAFHLVLPALTLGMVMAAFTCRLTRSSMLEVLPRQFVRTAQAKGTPQRRVIYHHALRNALIPVSTGFGIYILTMLSGSIPVELVFSRPGLGTVLVTAILSRDYPVVQGSLALFTLFVVGVNMAMDVVYVLVDPRIRTTA